MEHQDDELVQKEREINEQLFNEMEAAINKLRPQIKSTEDLVRIQQILFDEYTIIKKQKMSALKPRSKSSTLKGIGR